MARGHRPETTRIGAAATTLWRVVRQVVTGYFVDGCGFMAAAIAFYAFFALFPFVLLVITILAHLISPAVIHHHIIEFVDFYLPTVTPLAEENIRRMLAVRTQVGIAAVLALFWASSGVFTALQSALNRVWKVPGRRSIIVGKVRDLVAGAFIAVLTVAGLAGYAALRAAQLLDGPLAAMDSGIPGRLIPLVVAVALFSLAYRFVPNATPPLEAALVGGLVAGVWAEGVRILLTWYVRTLSPHTLVYGSLGVVIALMFWIYLTASGLLLGAEVAVTLDHDRCDAN